MAQGTTKGVPIDIDGTLSQNSDLLVASQKATKTYVDNGLSLKQNTIGYTTVNKGGDTMLGNLILNANPTLPFQAATKDYIDTLVNGIDWKQAAVASTVSALPSYNVTGSGTILTGASNGAIPSATTDGVTLASGNRVLVKNETSTLTPNNGIYVVTQTGSGSTPFILTRASDADTSSEISEATLSISSGSTLSNSQWHCNPATTPVVIGATYITFAQIGSGTYTAGAGLTLSSNVFSVATNGVTDAMIQSATNWNTAYANRITTANTPLSISSNTISISQATNSVDGYLSSTDWTTFNGKQDAITLTTTGTSGAATLVGATLNIPQYQSVLTNPVTGTGTANEISYWTSSSAIGSLSTATYPSLTELIYVKGVTSSIQTQFSGKQDTLTLTTTGTSGAATLVGSTLNIPQYSGGASIGGTITGGTTGSVLFINPTNTLAQDNANFFWDDTNNRLGIGTSTPSAILHSVGSVTASGGFARGNYFQPTLVASANSDALVGLEIIPTFTLGAFTGLTYYGLRIRQGTFAGNNGSQIAIMPTDANGAVIGSQGGSWNAFGIWGAGRWTTSSTPDFRIFGTGVVNINTKLLINTATDAGYLLDVNGIGRFTGALTITAANSTTTGGGQLYLNGATGNRIDFNANGVAAPAFTTRSVGTKIVLYSGIGASAVDFGFGIEAGTLWSSIPEATGVYSYKWYAGTTNILQLTGLGAMTLSRNQNAATSISASNTTSGTSSSSQISATSDATSGATSIGKYSTTTTAYKIIAAKDGYLYNGAVAGDIGILNDFTSGTIKFAAGGSSTVHVTIGTTGLTTFATGVDYKRLNPTTVTTASTATLTPDISAGDTFTITAQAVALSVANPTGTPVNGQKMIIRIEDNGTARAITWSGTQYRASTDLALPTTTISTKTMYLGFIYNSTDTKWDLLAYLNNF